MNKVIVLLFLLTNLADSSSKSEEFSTNQGQVSFFSYTSVENIEAQNNQVLSIIDLSENKIAISMLMNSFVFKKALMYEHFNESYIESDLYPKAIFEGKILDFDASLKQPQTKMIKGTLSLHGISKELEIKTMIDYTDQSYTFSGEFEVTVKDFNIQIPPILTPNISKTIAVKFNFEYQPYEK